MRYEFMCSYEVPTGLICVWVGYKSTRCLFPWSHEHQALAYAAGWRLWNGGRR